MSPGRSDAEREHLASLVGDMRLHGSDWAVIEHRGNRRVRTSYAELARLSGRISAFLRERRVAPGDRIVIWGESSAEWIAVFFGCLLRGALAVPLDPGSRVEFAKRVIADTGPVLIVGDIGLVRQVEGTIPTLGFHVFDRTLPKLAEYDVDSSVGLDTPFQIVFTSGTTSDPKGIVHTHRNVLASLTPIAREIRKYRRWERVVHPLRFLHTLPLSHVFGQFTGLWIPSLLGAEVHFAPNLAPSRLEETIRGDRINALIAVPRVLELLRRHLLASDSDLGREAEQLAPMNVWRRWWKLRRVHRRLGWRFWAIVCGGATLPPQLEMFWHVLGIPVIQGYGMTETAALVTLNHPFRVARGTLGKVLPGREVRIGEGGEVLVRGDMLAAGTWKGGSLQPREEDWLATGDLALQDATGELRFVGRKGDVIVTGSGLNVHPADLEAALLAEPGMNAAAVVGCEGPNGDEPVAVVIFNGNETEMAEAIRNANARLAGFQQIRRFLRWPDVTFPYTSTGKLLRRQVTAWAWGALQGAAVQAVLSDSLLQLVAEVTGEPGRRTSDEARLTEDLHLDSLGRVQLQSLVETRFDIEIGDDTMARLQTLGELRTLVHAPDEQRLRIANPEVGRETAPTSQRHGWQSEEAEPEALSYPCWPWWAPFQWIRAAFLEAIVNPLIRVLAAPRITRETARLPKGPMLLIANHVTAYDAPLVLAALPGRLRRHVAIAMSGELLTDLRRGRGQTSGLRNFLAPLGYWLITALFNVFPLPRLRGLRKSFAHAGKALDRGYSVLVFPEGRRTNGELQPFRQGIGLLAGQSRVPVLPVVLGGLGDMKPTSRWVRSGRLVLRVGTPIELGPDTSPGEWTAVLQDAVKRTLERARQSQSR